MGDAPSQRRLAAILAADVAGYTRLVEQDTEGTVAAWKAARDDVIKPIATEKSGHIIKFTGDGFLIEFPSVQDAVACAITFQEKLTSSPLNFRIGISMGDITDDGGDLHGEGVNIAARLEGLAEPGSICISDSVYEQVHNRIKTTYKDLGERKVKNISRPVRVWQITTETEPESETVIKNLDQKVRYCTSQDGTALAYATAGQGPALLKAPNFMSHLEHDWHSPTFGPFFQEMAANYHFVRFDQRGNGLSDRNPKEISFELYIQDLEAVADATGLERFALYGLSQGASVAISYAVRHPERVSAIILQGGFARGRLRRPNLSENDIVKGEAIRNLVRTGWGQENPAFRQMFSSLFIPGASSEIMDSFNDLMRVATAPDLAAQILEVHSQIDVSNILHQVQAPALILHCREDAVAPFEEGRLLATSIPDTQMVELDSANHILLHDEPATQRMYSEIHNFLAEHPD